MAQTSLSHGTGKLRRFVSLAVVMLYSIFRVDGLAGSVLSVSAYSGRRHTH